MMLNRAWWGVWSALESALRACATAVGVRARIGWLGLVAIGFAAAASGAQPVWEEVLTGPAPRVDHAIAYDAARGEVVLFGGFDGSRFGDTWIWDGAAWTLRATTGPSPREKHAMAYDAARGEVVLFGGYDASARLGDTWAWDGTAWTRRATTGPSPRANHAMAYDAARGEVVLFGGYDGARVGDTWVWGRGADLCPADLNNDGVVNTQDFLAYLSAWATGDPLADWNEDGAIDTRDFIAYLGAWSAGC